MSHPPYGQQQPGGSGYPGPPPQWGQVPQPKKSKGPVIAAIVGGVFVLGLIGSIVDPDKGEDTATGAGAGTPTARPSTPAPVITPTSPAAYVPATTAPVIPTSAPATTAAPADTLAGAGGASTWNGKVCGQSPVPGTRDLTTRVTFDTVKIEESCP